MKNEKDFVKKHIKNCYETCESFVKIGKNIWRKNLDKKSNRELYNLFLKYYEKVVDYDFFLLVPISIEKSVVKLVEKGIKRILEERGKENLLQDYLDVFTKETKLIEVKKEKISLLKIKMEMEKNKNKITPFIDKKIEEHVKKYCWIPVYNVTHEPWDKKSFIKRLRKISKPELELNEMNAIIERRKKDTKRVIEELNPDKKLLNMIEILQEYVFLRTYRTDALRKVMYYIQPLVKEISRRAEITKKEAAQMTKEEIKEFLLKGKLLDKKLLKERIKRCLLARTNRGKKIISDEKEIERFIERELGKQKLKIEKLKGGIACRGIASGKVRIIKNLRDLKKIRNGDILVASMTTPDMTVFMRKVAAIVTDEGGITCHAAIVSREMNIPCIVGTENATKFLKNGDFVVVDAQTGVVERIPNEN
ncbi:MAG: hypothetical protein JSV92_01655 [archaeon]|nr:MAG: hypothetical protein JSV92_01655 [archaeon]